jgi:hypothetical protein
MIICLVSLAFDDTPGSHWHWDTTRIFSCDVELIIGRRKLLSQRPSQIQSLPVYQNCNSRYSRKYEQIVAILNSRLDNISSESVEIDLVEYPEYNQIDLGGSERGLLLLAKNIASLCIESLPGSGFSIISADSNAGTIKLSFKYTNSPWDT